MDILKGDQYRFYVTEPKLYFDTPQQKLLKRIDFMFNTYMRQNFVRGTVKDYLLFLRNFTTPEE